jgi:hypothetical protein
MNATVTKWEDAKLSKGTRVLIQGALMKFVKDLPEQSDEDVRGIEVEYKGMEMEMHMFRHYFTAVINEELRFRQ